jgi:hypothetical protein
MGLAAFCAYRIGASAARKTCQALTAHAPVFSEPFSQAERHRKSAAQRGLPRLSIFRWTCFELNCLCEQALHLRRSAVGNSHKERRETCSLENFDLRAILLRVVTNTTAYSYYCLQQPLSKVGGKICLERKQSFSS